MTRTVSRWLATLLCSVVASAQVVAQGEQPTETALCFTLPAGWSFVESPVAIRKPAPGTDRLLPSDGFVAVVSGMSSDDSGMRSRPLPSVGLAEVRFDLDGTGRVTWTKWLADAGASVRLAGGWDMTSDGVPDVLVCISPRDNFVFTGGTLMLVSSADGGIHSTTSVATDGLALGAGVPAVEDAADTSNRFLLEARNNTPLAKLVEFDVASSVARVVPLATDGARMVYDGLAWLGQENGRADPSIAVRIQEEKSVDWLLPDSRVVAIDLGTHEQRTLYKGKFAADMCRAVAVDGRASDDVMIAEVREEADECVWLELRRVASRTGEILCTSTFPLDDKVDAGGLMASFFGTSIEAWDDMDGDGTRDYACSIACTCPHDAWRLLLVSGATGAQIGCIDDAMLARHTGPSGPHGIAPWITVPLLITPGAAPAIGIGCGENRFESVPSIAVLDLSDCLSAR